jgi:glycosylphosphatidylinositol transamidase (GPIT) subunit GPI8
MRIIFPGTRYKEALEQGHLQSLYDRREYSCIKLFEQIEQDPSHKLKNLIPSLNTSFDSLRTVRKYKLPLIKTDRFKNSFIPSQAAKVTL